ncbi:blue (type 1) copper domain protein [Actinobacteria bacterium OK074]|nr:blue (type 1) copper domain protein [Actinobacteria bacterium OK074]
MAISTRVALRTTALAFSAALALAACSGSGSSSGSGGSGRPSGTVKAGSGTQVKVTESEYALKLSRSSFTPGTYTFTVDNVGKTVHALEVDGPGVSDARTKNVQGGGETSVTVTLKKGGYDLYCPVDGHKGLGMEQHIVVG